MKLNLGTEFHLSARGKVYVKAKCSCMVPWRQWTSTCAWQ